jgi:hypothetical protein
VAAPDALRYPAFKQMMEQQLAAKEAVSNMGPPKAIGEIRGLGTEAIEAECADFRAALDSTATHFVEPFVTAPSGPNSNRSPKAPASPRGAWGWGD